MPDHDKELLRNKHWEPYQSLDSYVRSNGTKFTRQLEFNTTSVEFQYLRIAVINYLEYLANTDSCIDNAIFHSLLNGVPYLGIVTID